MLEEMPLSGGVKWRLIILRKGGTTVNFFYCKSLQLKGEGLCQNAKRN
jgi:hypothetical protein